MKTARVILAKFRRIILLVYVGLWVAAFIATHIPGPELPSFHVSDKSLHVVGYAGLAVFFMLTLMAYGHPAFRRVTIVFCSLLVYAGVDEVTQPMFHRDADIRDWMADSVGIVIGILAAELAVGLLRWRRSRRHPLNTD